MTLIARRRVVAAKVESTAGTAETLAGSDSAFNAMNPVVTPNIGMTDIPMQGRFASVEEIPEGHGATVAFSTELRGDGAGGVPVWASTLMAGCGWVNSAGTLSPKSEAPSTNVKTLTIGVYEHGRRKLLKGCMGTATIGGQSGHVVMINWTFTGVWAGVTDTAEVTAASVAGTPMRLHASTLTIGGASPACIANLNIDLGNAVELLPCHDNSAGYKFAIVGGRKPKVALDPNAVLIATKDYFGQWLARTQAALSVVIQDSTDKITIAAPQLQVSNMAQQDRVGIMADNIDFVCCGSSGDDELTFAFAVP